jgi:hypothetical protein
MLKIELTDEEWQIIYQMINRHMKRNLLDFTDFELDTGWKFLAKVTNHDESCTTQNQEN